MDLCLLGTFVNLGFFVISSHSLYFSFREENFSSSEESVLKEEKQKAGGLLILDKRIYSEK